jgi:diacylglycerol kinase family enzyme
MAPVAVGPAAVARLLTYAVSGRALPRSALRVHDVDRIVVRCDRPLALQADGEDLGDAGEALFEAERAAVSVLAMR